MAATWRATAGAVAYANAKDMLNVFNANASRVMRVYRAWHFNNGTAAVTGVLTTMQCRRITAASAGTGVTPVAHDTTSSALSSMTAGTNQTVTGGDIFRRYVYSNDEPAVSGATQDEWECLVPFAQVWDSGYGDSNVEPITCRQNQGFELYHSGSSAVGTADLEIEFTDAAS